MRKSETGKAQGPFDEEEVDNLLGKCWSPSRRVGLRQGGPSAQSTTSLNLGNGSSGTCDYQEVSGVDGVCAMMKTRCSAVDDESVEVELATGEVRRGELHEGFRAKSSRFTVGRALDLAQGL